MVGKTNRSGIGPLSGMARTIGTIFDGMSITSSYLFHRPITVQYPDVKIELPAGARGRLAFREENCTACTLCEKACPVGCISVQGVKMEGRKGRAPVRFDLNEGGCMYCGLCVESCHAAALVFTTAFEGATTVLADLQRNMISDELTVKRLAVLSELQSDESPLCEAAG